MKESKIRVLLVDDEKELVDNLRKRLVRRGMQVVGTYSGREAIAVAKDAIFDVAVIDLKMPELDGVAVLEALKDEQPLLQAIMLTAHGSIDAALQSGRHDASQFLQKPFSADELAPVIEKAKAKRVKAQRDGYDDEVADLASKYSSPRDLIRETKALRDKYEQ